MRARLTGNRLGDAARSPDLRRPLEPHLVAAGGIVFETELTAEALIGLGAMLLENRLLPGISGDHGGFTLDHPHPARPAVGGAAGRGQVDARLGVALIQGVE